MQRFIHGTCDDNSAFEMEAAVYTEFGGKIAVKTVLRPTLQDDFSVIVNVMATGVCRSDWHGWKGHDDDIKNHGMPFIPGHEFSGVVVDVGNLVKKIRKGDHVAIPFILSCGHCAECQFDRPTVCLQQAQPGFTMNGSFAEFIAISRADRNLRKIPDGVSFVEAAALGCRFTTAYRAVVQQGLRLNSLQSLRNLSSQNRTHRSSRRIMCIFGCGGLGLSCIMIARAFKTEGNISSIIAIDVNTHALDKALELGADSIVNANSLTNDAIREKVLYLTHGLGAELTIDAAGFSSTCENSIHCTRRGGRMVQVGLPIGSHRPDVPMGLICGRELEIVGSHGFDAKELPDLLDLVLTGKLDVKKLVEKEISLEEGAVALMSMDKGSPLGMWMITKFRENSSKL